MEWLEFTALTLSALALGLFWGYEFGVTRVEARLWDAIDRAEKAMDAQEVPPEP